jgi:hypothetical protein
MDLDDCILLGFWRDELGFKGIFKVYPCSIVYLSACLGGGNAIAGLFSGLGSEFKVSQRRTDFLCIIGEGSCIEVVVVLE